MSIDTMNRMSSVSLSLLSLKEKEKRSTQTYQAYVVISQASIVVSIVAVSGMLRTRRKFNGNSLDKCQALFKQYSITKIFWS